MFYKLKRHPFLVRAHFDFTLVLTYAFPAETLKPLLPPGLTLDSLTDIGFVAIALVATREMRPDFLPAWAGKKFFLSGYRIFARYNEKSGRSLRGLQILRSDTDSSFMTAAGNLLTHYHYEHSKIAHGRQGNILSISVKSPDGGADLELSVDLAADEATALPANSCFKDKRDALKFAGPLPFTFNYEEQTNSIIRVEGVRQEWHPRLVSANVQKVSYFDRPPFADCGPPRLVSAFYLEDIPYHWKPGVTEKIQNSQTDVASYSGGDKS